jgi:hypothetical protein
MCTVEPFNYKPNDYFNQNELNIHNILYFLNLNYYEKDPVKGCGIGTIYYQIPYNQYIDRAVFITSDSIIMLRDNILVTITNLSFKKKDYDFTFMKIKQGYVFSIICSSDKENIYNLDLNITPKSDTTKDIFTLNRISIYSENGNPNINLKNGNIYFINNNKIINSRSITQFFFYDMFGGDYKYKMNRYFPIIVNNIAKKVYSEEMCKINDNNSLKTVLLENDELIRDAEYFETTLKTNLINFVDNNKSIIVEPLVAINEYDEFIINKNNFLMFIVTMCVILIACCISVIILAIKNKSKKSKKSKK